MCREAFVGDKIREGLNECDERVLHEAETGQPEDSHTGYGGCSPVAVQVLLQGLMEDTVATKSKMGFINTESWDRLSQIVSLFTYSKTYPLIVSLSTRSLKSPGSLGVMFMGSRGDLA